MRSKLFSKKLIIEPSISTTSKELNDFLTKLNDKIVMLYIDPKKLIAANIKFKTISTATESNYIISENNIENISGKKIGKKIKVLSNSDIEKISTLSKAGLDFIIVEFIDWKIIPLENIIAKLHKMNTEIFVSIKNLSEMQKMFSILEIGVDGVILKTSSVGDVNTALSYFNYSYLELKKATIINIKEVGNGERVCVDTISMLQGGEGMLVGNNANFLFLIHNESIGSSFTTPRPFRVNAGAVHCYTMVSDNTTKYLSELESGKNILIIDHDGNTRKTTVGRSKIEKRPMIMIKAKIDNNKGSVIVQNAETIRLIKDNKEPISVTKLKEGDTVLGYFRTSSGRHFGMEINEYILEK
ncbi:MAG: 3-dehydroquinate synthase [Thaumarchaeota archaeon]|nr:3-dehydroquinate synthase [Nitrososphaerota archaeon]